MNTPVASHYPSEKARRMEIIFCRSFNKYQVVIQFEQEIMIQPTNGEATVLTPDLYGCEYLQL